MKHSWWEPGMSRAEHSYIWMLEYQVQYMCDSTDAVLNISKEGAWGLPD